MWGGDPADLAASRTIEALDAMRAYAQSLLELAYDRTEKVERAVENSSDGPCLSELTYEEMLLAFSSSPRTRRLRIVCAVRRRLCGMVLARAVAIPKLAGILEVLAVEVRADPALELLAVELDRCARNVRATFIDDRDSPPPGERSLSEPEAGAAPKPRKGGGRKREA